LGVTGAASDADHNVRSLDHSGGLHAGFAGGFVGMDAVIVTVGDTSIMMCEVVAPVFTVLIVPAI
jgi:hypothetical protein